MVFYSVLEFLLGGSVGVYIRLCYNISSSSRLGRIFFLVCFLLSASAGVPVLFRLLRGSVGVYSSGSLLVKSAGVSLFVSTSVVFAACFLSRPWPLCVFVAYNSQGLVR